VYRGWTGWSLEFCGDCTLWPKFVPNWKKCSAVVAVKSCGCIDAFNLWVPPILKTRVGGGMIVLEKNIVGYKRDTNLLKKCNFSAVNYHLICYIIYRGGTFKRCQAILCNCFSVLYFLISVLCVNCLWNLVKPFLPDKWVNNSLICRAEMASPNYCIACSLYGRCMLF